MDKEFTLEKQKIAERLASLETAQRDFIKTHETEGKRLCENIEKLNQIILGNGRPGVVGRLGLIEDKHKEHQQNGRIAKVAFFGVAAKYFWDLFFHVR